MYEDNILFFDCETSGLSVYKDKIISISFILNGKTKTFMINPEIPISEAASRVHGIYDRDVTNLKPFSYYAESIMKILKMADFYCFYNGRNFDYPILYIELLRCGYSIPEKPIIDVYEHIQLLFRSLKLKDIYRTLLNKNFKNHDSLEDTKATMELYYYIQNKFLK